MSQSNQSSIPGTSRRRREEKSEYTVEKVIDRKLVKGKVFYLLKWEGYPDSDNSWVQAKNIHCPLLIKEYEKTRKQKVIPSRPIFHNFNISKI